MNSKPFCCALLIFFLFSLNSKAEIIFNPKGKIFNKFSKGLVLTVDETSQYYEIDLPEDVYAQSKSAKLKDIVLVNGKGEIMPFILTEVKEFSILDRKKRDNK